MKSLESRYKKKNFLLFQIFSTIYLIATYIFSRSGYFLTIEIVGIIVSITVFIFAYETKKYSEDASNVYIGISFLFCFIFEIAYLGYISINIDKSFIISQKNIYLWISSQWFFSIAILIGIDKKKPDISIFNISIISGSIAIILIAIQLLFDSLIEKITTIYLLQYVIINSLVFILLAAYTFIRLKINKTHLSYKIRINNILIINLFVFLGINFGLLIENTMLMMISYYGKYLSFILVYDVFVHEIIKNPFEYLYKELINKSNSLIRINKEQEDLILYKNVLLRELNHRVKNNMQIISSILNLQAKSSENKAFDEAVIKSQNRIQIMAMIHEHLYNDYSNEKINTCDYFNSLLSYCKETYGYKDIKIEAKISETYVSIGFAMNCGLIINEVVTNSIKHAFPEKIGKIEVKFINEGDYYLLMISDNGIGKMDNKDRKLSSLGYYLIDSFVSQLSGTYTIKNENGTIVEFKFPCIF